MQPSPRPPAAYGRTRDAPPPGPHELLTDRAARRVAGVWIGVGIIMVAVTVTVYLAGAGTDWVLMITMIVVVGTGTVLIGRARLFWVLLLAAAGILATLTTYADNDGLFIAAIQWSALACLAAGLLLSFRTAVTVTILVTTVVAAATLWQGWPPTGGAVPVVAFNNLGLGIGVAVTMRTWRRVGVAADLMEAAAAANEAAARKLALRVRAADPQGSATLEAALNTLLQLALGVQDVDTQLAIKSRAGDALARLRSQLNIRIDVLAPLPHLPTHDEITGTLATRIMVGVGGAYLCSVTILAVMLGSLPTLAPIIGAVLISLMVGLFFYRRANRFVLTALAILAIIVGVVLVQIPGPDTCNSVGVFPATDWAALIAICLVLIAPTVTRWAAAGAYALAGAGSLLLVTGSQVCQLNLLGNIVTNICALAALLMVRHRIDAAYPGICLAARYASNPTAPPQQLLGAAGELLTRAADPNQDLTCPAFRHECAVQVEHLQAVAALAGAPDDLAAPLGQAIATAREHHLRLELVIHAVPEVNAGRARHVCAWLSDVFTQLPPGTSVHVDVIADDDWLRMRLPATIPQRIVLQAAETQHMRVRVINNDTWLLATCGR